MNLDEIGNRVAAIVFGLGKVILPVCIPKIAKTTEDAVTRIKNHVAPRNSIMVNNDTPCSKKRFCQDPHCMSSHRICSQLMILESSMFPGRIRIFLVDEELEY